MGCVCVWGGSQGCVLPLADAPHGVPHTGCDAAQGLRVSAASHQRLRFTQGCCQSLNPAISNKP